MIWKLMQFIEFANRNLSIRHYALTVIGHFSGGWGILSVVCMQEQSMKKVRQPSGSTRVLALAMAVGLGSVTSAARAANDLWTDANGDNSWFTGPTPGLDWSVSGSSAAFTNGDAVLFDDTPTNPSAFNIGVQAVGVNPGSMTFNNFSNTYNISGGPIGGVGTTLTLNGGGTAPGEKEKGRKKRGHSPFSLQRRPAAAIEREPLDSTSALTLQLRCMVPRPLTLLDQRRPPSSSG
jgi:hypothetical protein